MIQEQNLTSAVSAFPVFKDRYSWYSGITIENYRSTTEVRFVTGYNPPTGAISWDAGVNAGEITAYMVGSVITISSNGKSKIRMVGNIGDTFCRMNKLRTVSGLDMVDVSEATSCGGMFAECPELTEVDLSTWCCDNLTHANGMFNKCPNLKKVKLPYSMSSCGSAYGIFGECVSLEYADLGGLNVVNTASNAAYPIFVGCTNLREVVLCDVSVMEAAARNNVPLFTDCTKLRKVVFKGGAVIAYESLFEDMTNIQEVDFYGPITTIPAKTFSKCLNLERVRGLSHVTVIGDRAFVYTAKLIDIDLNPAILTSIGESAFRLSSIEDCINMESLNTACTVGEMATRAVRWSAEALSAIQNTVTPCVLLRVPHADSQKNYSADKYIFAEAPFPAADDPVVEISVADGGCQFLALYHEWQCIHRGTALEKANFDAFWDDFFADFFTRNNSFHDDAVGEMGWVCDDSAIVNGQAALGAIINRLNSGLPTGVSIRSANINGYHAVLIIGSDPMSGKLAVLDSNITNRAELVWVKFEDIFTGAGDYDRLHIHSEITA